MSFFYILEGKKVGVIIVKSIFSINFYKYIKDLFGFKDLKHPGYRMLQETGNLFVGGPIKKVLFPKL